MKLKNVLSFDASEITIREIKKHLKECIKKGGEKTQLDFALPQNVYVIEKFEFVFCVNDFTNELKSKNTFVLLGTEAVNEYENNGFKNIDYILKENIFSFLEFNPKKDSVKILLNARDDFKKSTLIKEHEFLYLKEHFYKNEYKEL